MYYEMNGNILPQIQLINRLIIESPGVHIKNQKEEYVIFFVVKGVLYLQEKQYIVSEGDMIFLESDYIHYDVLDEKCELYVIHFNHMQMTKYKTNDWLEKSMNDEKKSSKKENVPQGVLYLSNYIRLSDQEVYKRVFHIMTELMEFQMKHCDKYDIICACRLMEIFVEISVGGLPKENLFLTFQTPQTCKRVQKLLQFLNINYAKDISGKIIEEEFACNFDYLNRIFKKATGRTIFVYLTERRIQQAKILLGTTAMKVAAVGYEVGFRDEYYFNKVFKKYTGTSPGRYERIAQMPKW